MSEPTDMGGPSLVGSEADDGDRRLDWRSGRVVAEPPAAQTTVGAFLKTRPRLSEAFPSSIGSDRDELRAVSAALYALPRRSGGLARDLLGRGAFPVVVQPAAQGLGVDPQALGGLGAVAAQLRDRPGGVAALHLADRHHL